MTTYIAKCSWWGDHLFGSVLWYQMTMSVVWWYTGGGYGNNL